MVCFRMGLKYLMVVMVWMCCCHGFCCQGEYVVVMMGGCVATFSYVNSFNCLSDLISRFDIYCIVCFKVNSILSVY